MERFIDSDHWSAAAGTHAFDFFKGEATIRSCLVVRNAQTLLHVLVEFVATTEHAADVRAYLNVVPTHWLFKVHRVERRDPKDMCIGKVHHTGDFLHDVFREPTPLLLRHPENGHDCGLWLGILCLEGRNRVDVFSGECSAHERTRHERDRYSDGKIRRIDLSKALHEELCTEPNPECGNHFMNGMHADALLKHTVGVELDFFKESVVDGVHDFGSHHC